MNHPAQRAFFCRSKFDAPNIGLFQLIEGYSVVGKMLQPSSCDTPPDESMTRSPHHASLIYAEKQNIILTSRSRY